MRIEKKVVFQKKNSKQFRRSLKLEMTILLFIKIKDFSLFDAAVDNTTKMLFSSS